MTEPLTETEGETKPLLASQTSKKVSFHQDERTASNRDLRRAFSYFQEWTKSERESATKRKGVGPASFLICDAILGFTEDPAEGSFDPYDENCHPLRSYISIKCRRLVTGRSFVIFIQLVSFFMVALSFVEPPVWCRENVYSDPATGVEGCEGIMDLRGAPADALKSNHEVYLYPSTRIVIVTSHEAQLIEWACASFLFLFIILRLGRDGMSIRCYLRPGPRQLVRSAQLVAILGTVCSLLLAPVYAQRPLSYFLRIVIAITMSRHTQREIVTVFRLVPEILDILALLFVVILFYAWVGVMAFYETEEGVQHFSNLVEGMWSLWTCVTTANYPDVMMPGYNENRWVALYFVSFMVVSFFFFMNVILGSVVNSYANVNEEREKKRDEIAAEDLKKAFRLMDQDNDGVIDRETVMALFAVLDEDFPQLPKISEDSATLLFAVLDKEGANHITAEEFQEFSNVMLLEFEKTQAFQPPIQRIFPKISESAGFQRFSRFVQSDSFEYWIDLFLVLNAVVVAIQSYPLLVGQTVEVNPHTEDGEIDTIWETIETGFTTIYCIEMICKLLVLGWSAFSKSYRNLFDLTITAVAVLATAYVYYPNHFSDSRLIRYVVMARVLRLARVLVAIKKFRVIGTTCVEILPATSRVILLLFCIMYIFAAIGMLCFGGLITRDPSNKLAYVVLGTSFAEDEYWANNFNDMLGGMNVLFHLLVVNNWTTTESGLVAVTGTKWTRLYFLCFHICAVIIVNNVVVAVVIGAFETQWDVYNQRERMIEVVGGEAIIGERQAWFNASEVTGTKTKLSGRYVAKVRKTRLGAQRKLLRHLFTRTSSSFDQGSGDSGKSEHSGSVREEN